MPGLSAPRGGHSVSTADAIREGGPAQARQPCWDLPKGEARPRQRARPVGWGTAHPGRPHLPCRGPKAALAPAAPQAREARCSRVCPGLWHPDPMGTRAGWPGCSLRPVPAHPTHTSPHCLTPHTCPRRALDPETSVDLSREGMWFPTAEGGKRVLGELEGQPNSSELALGGVAGWTDGSLGKAQPAGAQQLRLPVTGPAAAAPPVGLRGQRGTQVSPGSGHLLLLCFTALLDPCRGCTFGSQS